MVKRIFKKIVKINEKRIFFLLVSTKETLTLFYVNFKLFPLLRKSSELHIVQMKSSVDLIFLMQVSLGTRKVFVNMLAHLPKLLIPQWYLHWQNKIEKVWLHVTLTALLTWSNTAYFLFTPFYPQSNQGN